MTKKRILDDNLKSYNLWDQITINSLKDIEFNNKKELKKLNQFN